MVQALPLEIGDYNFDDGLIAAARAAGKARYCVYRLPEVLVVLGRGSKVEKELDVAACVADGVRVLRRKGGGCAVVLDPGQLVVSVALPAHGIGDNKRYLEHLCHWLRAGLQSIGAKDIEQAGISDLAQQGRKISGSCVHRARDLLYYSATLLVEPQVALMGRYLAHPPREPDYRGARRHEDFVAGLRHPSLRGAVALESALRNALASRASALHITGP